MNNNTDVAPFLRQEFIRIRPNREGDREAIVAGKGPGWTEQGGRLHSSSSFCPSASSIILPSSDSSTAVTQPSSASHFPHSIIRTTLGSWRLCLCLGLRAPVCPVLAHSSPFSSTDENVHRPRDALHPDQEAGPPHAHSSGAAGAAGGRAPRQLVTDTATGGPPVILRVLLSWAGLGELVIKGIGPWGLWRGAQAVQCPTLTGD